MAKALTARLCFSIFSATLGMLQFGYNTGVINAPQKVHQERHGVPMDDGFNNLCWSLTVAIFALGGMLGGLSAGSLANRYGRKIAMLLNASLGNTAAIVMGTAKPARSYEAIIVGRFLIGVSCGMSTSLSPMYVSEIAPVSVRGALGVLNQLAVTMGLLLSQVLGIEEVLGNAVGWPYLLGLAVVPATLQLVLLPFCPESPRFLLLDKGDEGRAKTALWQLRGRRELQVEAELEEISREGRDAALASRVSVWGLLRSPALPLVIAVVMQLSQQLSGINAIFYYSSSIFQASGLSEISAGHATIGVGGVMVVMTLVSIPLMERQGRRRLHLLGLGGMFIASILLTVFLSLRFDQASKVCVLWVLAFVVFFAIGPGSIPWLITAELFSQGPRPAAMSIAVFVNWMANFAVGLTYIHMQEALGDFSFVPFSVLLALFWIFTYKKVPETKNKTFEEISKMFAPSSS